MNLFFWRKLKKKKDLKSDSSLVLPQDKQEISNLAKEKTRHIKSLEDIDRKIYLIQNATNTFLPKFDRLHHLLRQKYRWYYNWHNKPYYRSVHWLILILYLLSLPLFVYSFTSHVNKAKAITYDFPRWEWVNPNPTGNDLTDMITIPNGNSFKIGSNGTIIKHISGSTYDQEYTGVTNNLKSAAYASTDPSGNIVVVGDSGMILQYQNGSWTQRASGLTPENLNKVIWAQNQFNAVGDNGKIATSTDGTTWSLVTLDPAVSFKDLAVLSSGTIVAVGGNSVYYSTNGTSWSAASITGAHSLLKVTVSSSGTVVVVGTSGDIFYSTNGTSWTKVAGLSANFNSVAVSSTNTFVAVGNGGAIYGSTNGTSWSVNATSPSAADYNFLDVSWSSSYSAFNAVGASGAFYSGTSSSTWTQSTLTPTTTKTFNRVNGETAIGNDGMIYGITGNTASSNQSSCANFSSGTSIAVSPTGTYVAVGYQVIHDVFGAICYSTDGETWTPANISENSWTFNKVIYANGFYAIDGTAKKVFRSSDGISWTKSEKYPVELDLGTLTGIAGSDNATVVYNSTGKVFFNYGADAFMESSTSPLTGFSALSASSSTNKYVAINSTNNTVYYGYKNTVEPYEVKFDTSASTFADTTLRATAAAPNGNFVAVGDSGKIYHSTNAGITWTAATLSASTIQDFKQVVTSSSKMIASGTNNTIYYSSDNGANWTPVTWTPSAPSGETLTNLAATQGNKFIANSGNSNFYVSFDGITWQKRTYASASSIVSIAGHDDSAGNPSFLSLSSTANIFMYHSPTNATATTFQIKLPGQLFDPDTGVSGTPNSVQAGESVLATIYAVDSLNHNKWDVGNASTVAFTTTDSNATNPSSLTLTPVGCLQTTINPCGYGTKNVIFYTAGARTITASDTGQALASGTSSNITVTAGAIDKLVFSGFPTSLNAGAVSSAITVRMQDHWGNAATSPSSKTIHLSTTSSKGKFAQSSTGPWSDNTKDITIAAGSSSATFYYYDFNTGSQTITAAETPSAGWTDATGTVTIAAGTLSNSTLSVDKNSIGAGETFGATVTLKNSEGATLTDKTVQLFSSRNSDTTTDSISPSSANTDSNGVANFTVKATSTGSFVLSAYDQSDNLYIPGEQTISVGPGELGKITLASSADTMSAGSKMNITTTLYDNYNNLATSYTGKIQFSSSDSDAQFSESIHTFTSADSAKNSQEFILKTDGTQSVSAISDNNVRSTIYIKVTPATASPAAILTPKPSVSITVSPTEEPAKTLIETFQESPVAQTISKALTPITATVAALGLLPLLVQAFPQGFHILASLFPAIFTAAAVRRRRKPWGIVYDSFTGKPIDLAIVRVFNFENDRLIATKVTDQNGRFNFLLSKGKYYVKVTKSGYTFPPKVSKLKASQLATRIGPQSDVYFGQPFIIGIDDTNINLNICLDPKLSTLSFGTKLIMWIKNGFDWFLIALSYISTPLMLFGAVFAALATVIIPSTFNLYMSGFYVIVLIAYLISHKIQLTRLDLVFDAKSRNPIAGATVTIFDKEYSAIREIKITDPHGHFAILAQKGQYYVTVNAKNYKFPSKDFKFAKKDKKLGKIYFGETINNKKAAFVNVSVPLDKDIKK